MAIRLTSGYPCKVSFRFFDEQGNILTDIDNPKATLYSTITGEAILTNLSLDFNPDTNTFDLVFTPDSDLSGTYYFIASGNDSYGINRKASLFVDIVPLPANYLLIGYDQAVKFINDQTIDYSVLPSLIYTAVEWVQDLLGRVIFPTRITERLMLSGEFLYLTKYPLIRVNSIINAETNQVIENTKYIVYNANSGIIKFTDIRVIRERDLDLYVYDKVLREAIVDYVAGYNPIPETIYTAIGMVVGYLYDRAKYQNFDRIRMLGVEGYISKDVLQKIKEILSPYMKRI